MQMQEQKMYMSREYNGFCGQDAKMHFQVIKVSFTESQ